MRTSRTTGLPVERGLAPVSVGRAVGVFLLAGLAVLTVLGAVLALAQRQAATVEAIRDARTLTNLQARDVVGPSLTREALVPGPAQDALDDVVRRRVLGDLIVRVKIWDETGRVVYSDDTDLIGQQFPLPPAELAALREGKVLAEVSDLDEAENAEESHFGKLLQVYLGVRTQSGQPLLFETYQPYDTIDEASRRQWRSSLPVLVGGLVLLYLVQAPLAYRMARRLRAAQEEREQLLLAALAAADRERTRIASDLHDGVVQGLAGASYGLSATAGSARSRGDTGMADALDRTAVDLRRWVRELRTLVVTVVPPALHDQGLGAALDDLAATLRSRGLDVHLEVDDAQGVPADVEALVYRVAQEAVRNVVRHAGAARLDLSLSRHGDDLLLRVSDDGQGYDPRARSRRTGSVGLELLARLVAAQGGQLEVTSVPGAGVEVLLTVPAGVGPLPAAVPTPVDA